MTDPSTVQPWLVTRDTGRLLEFVATVFGGEELARVPTADGAIGHAEIRVVTALDDGAWGDRGGRIRDPLGNIWWVVQHVEDVPADEIAARLQHPRSAEAMRRAQATLDAEPGGGGWSSPPVL